VVLELLVDHIHGARGVVVVPPSGSARDVVDAAQIFDAEGGVFESGGCLLLLLASFHMMEAHPSGEMTE